MHHLTPAELVEQLATLRSDMLAAPLNMPQTIAHVHGDNRESAVNLLAYLAFRRRDAREIQRSLSSLGLTSLGRSEPHVIWSVTAALQHALRLAGSEKSVEDPPYQIVDFERGRELLDLHTERLLGPRPQGRTVRIMVTMPSEASDSYSLIHSLVANGMNVMRINCAHDDKEAWSRMIDHLRRAERELGKRCRILMDLGGPKLRTGSILPGPAVVRWRPQRDRRGVVVAPARIWLTNAEHPSPAPAPASAVIPVDSGFLDSLSQDQLLQLTDTRKRRRALTLTSREDGGWWAECDRTTYIENGTVLQSNSSRTSVISGLPPTEQSILLHRGDQLLLTRNEKPGRPAEYDKRGKLRSVARISCTLPDVFGAAKPGERIWFDDGQIGGVIREVSRSQIAVDIVQAKTEGSRLRAEKGINLPDTDLQLSALTDRDFEDLPFVAEHADMIGFSFVHRAADIIALEEALSRLTDRRPAVVLKIETRRAFESLPQLLLTSLRYPAAGIMIARGDLAVELGYERLAEVQEQILWIAEAAHTPVIWATQVLETLARTGLPSRSEITDAAMSQRAECVMLNKGPHIVEAIQVLDGILQRMEHHQRKKQALLRRLRSWSTVSDTD